MKMVKPSKIMDHIMNVWDVFINSSKKELYLESIIQFSSVCEKYQNFLKYVESKILDQVNENFICVWTNHVRHLGNTTTNWVEYSLTKMKIWLGNSKWNFRKVWELVNQRIEMQHNEIHTSFGWIITIREHKFKDKWCIHSWLTTNFGYDKTLSIMKLCE